jgi:hypothetical protein
MGIEEPFKIKKIAPPAQFSSLRPQIITEIVVAMNAGNHKYVYIKK